MPGFSSDTLPNVTSAHDVYSPPQDIYGIVKESYAKAQLSKSLTFEQIPREVPINSLGVGRWDPFELQRHHLKKAILTSDKVRNIHELISKTTLKLPTASEWETFASKNDLRAETIRGLLFEALCSDVASVPSPIRSTPPNLDVRFWKGHAAF